MAKFAPRTNKSWTNEDEFTLVNIILANIENHGNTRGAFTTAATKLGHTEIACRTKWHKELKQDFQNEIEAIKKRRVGIQPSLSIPSDIFNSTTYETTDDLKEVLISFDTFGEQYYGDIKAHLENCYIPVDSISTIGHVHIIQYGETLTSIAQKYGVTVEELVKLNGLRNPDYIVASRPLLIPANPTVTTVTKEQAETFNPNKSKKSNSQTNLQTLIKSIKSMESESLKIINSGKGGTDYIVINNEEDFGYLVTTENGKVTSCNCPHHQFRDALCKHMIQVAISKNLEVF